MLTPDKRERPAGNRAHSTNTDNSILPTGTGTALDYGARLFPQHQEMLAASGVTVEQARTRGYVSVDTKHRLESLGITPSGRRVPGLLVPQLRADGSTWGYQYRPDSPRLRSGKPAKYETPTGQANGIDVPPGVGPKLADPGVPLWVTEGVKKADAAAVAGLACVALPGVWSWRGRNDSGGKTAVGDFHDIALNGRRVVLAFDSDVSVKPAVRRALVELAGYLSSKGALVEYAHLPNAGDGKTGLDDYLLTHTVEQLWALVRPDLPEPVEPVESVVPPALEATWPQVLPAPEAPVVSLAQARATFTRWLGQDYDLAALDAILAAAAVEQLDGDPLWLLLVSGPGHAKTETCATLRAAGATVTSTISSPGALLSASPARERAKDATGGLLRKLGARGVLVIKDVTSILSMSGESRGEVLAALREVYDGHWSRNVGTDGGRTLDWTGRLVVIGAVTTAWDQAHAVVSTMGDRFVLLRTDSSSGRVAAGRRAIANTGSETQMRAELGAAVAGVLAGVDLTSTSPTPTEAETLLRAADVVTLARTAVIRDYRGDVVDAHAPEAPTRYAKQLTQVLRGGVAIGMRRDQALRLAVRCARDSVPPLRALILSDVAEHPDSSTADVRRRVDKPRATVDRELQALHMLGLLDVEETDAQWAGKAVTRWTYRVRDGIDVAALDPQSVPDSAVHTPSPQEEAGEEQPTEYDALTAPTAESGTDSPPVATPVPPGTPAQDYAPGPNGPPEPTCQLCGGPLYVADVLAGSSVCIECDR